MFGAGAVRCRGKGCLCRSMLWRPMIMGLCVRFALGAASPLFPAGKLGELLALGLCALLGVALYFTFALLLGLDEAKLALSLVRRNK